MRKVIVAMVVAGLLGAVPVRADDKVDAGSEIGYALGAGALNIVYFPTKVVLAVSGLAVGALAGALTGGDARTAYAIWVPAASGTYIVRPEHLSGEQPLLFFGNDYADRPSTNVEYGWAAMAGAAYPKP